MIGPKNDTSGFYKLGNEANSLVISMEINNGTITKQNHNEYQYPLGDWYWFDNCETARSFWGLPEAEIYPETALDFSLIDPLILLPSLRPKYN